MRSVLRQWKLSHRGDLLGPDSMVRYGNDAPRAVWGNLNPGILARPRCLETRTERVFPHSHSDCGGGAVPFFQETACGWYALC